MILNKVLCTLNYFHNQKTNKMNRKPKVGETIIVLTKDDKYTTHTIEKVGRKYFQTKETEFVRSLKFILPNLREKQKAHDDYYFEWHFSKKELKAHREKEIKDYRERRKVEEWFEKQHFSFEQKKNIYENFHCA